MLRKLCRLAQCEAGQALAEVSASVLALLLLLAAGVDFGRGLHDYIVITNSAREGARYASHYPWKGGDIRSVAVVEATGGGISLQASDISIVPDPPEGGQPHDPSVAQPDSPIKVTVTYVYHPRFAALVGLASLTFHASCEMVVFGCDPAGGQ